MVDFLTGEQRDSLIELYIAYFNRAPESGGLSFHANAVIEDLNAGLDFDAALNNRADNFFDAAIDLGVYSNAMTADEFVAEVYENTLLRPGVGGDAPTEAELSYWTARLESGEIGRGDLVTEFLDSIDFLMENGTDDEVAVATQVNAVLENRVEVARVFSMPENSGGLTGQEAIAAGEAAIANVDGTQESVDEAIDNIEDGSVGVDGDIFTLTVDPDDVTGTAGDDVIRAVVGNSLDSTDLIDGGAGDDVLNIASGGIAAANAPVVQGVERINNSDAATSLDLADVTGVGEIWSRVTGAEYDNADLGVVFGVENIGAAGATVTLNLAADADLSGDEDSATIALNNNNGSGTIDVDIFEADGTTAADDDLEAVNLVTIDNGGLIDMTGYTGLETLSISGTGSVEATVGAANAALTTIDASANSGDVTVDASTVASLETLTSGDGADGLTVDGTNLDAAEVTVSAGAGSDDVTMVLANNGATTASAVTLEGGEDGDVFTLTNGTGASGNLAAATDVDDIMASLVTVADFEADADTLDISDLGVTRLAQNAVQSAVDGSNPDNLFDAATAAFTQTTGTSGNEEAVLFNYDGNAYIGVDVNDDGALSAGDALVELTGVAVSDLDASTNFVF